MHTDCWKLWDLLTSEEIKASQFTGDGWSIISRIIWLERKTKIEVEYVNIKTTPGDDDAIIIKV